MRREPLAADLEHHVGASFSAEEVAEVTVQVGRRPVDIDAAGRHFRRAELGDDDVASDGEGIVLQMPPPSPRRRRTGTGAARTPARRHSRRG